MKVYFYLFILLIIPTVIFSQEECDFELLKHLMNRDIASFKSCLLNHDLNLNGVTPEGNNILMLCITHFFPKEEESLRLKFIKAACKAKIDLSMRNNQNYNAFIVACHAANKTALEYLIKINAHLYSNVEELITAYQKVLKNSEYNNQFREKVLSIKPIIEQAIGTIIQLEQQQPLR